jgi:hypothetical protein
MAELLILAFDTNNKDAAQDVFAYKKGHVISVQPDGHKWGKEECLPKFYVVKLPKVSVADVKKYLDVQMNTLGDSTKVIGIRKYKLDVSSIPTAIKNTLESDGVITINKLSDFEAYVK